MKYITLENDTEEKNGSLLAEIQEQLTGKVIPKEAASLAGGKGFLQDWLEKKKGLEKAWKETRVKSPGRIWTKGPLIGLRRARCLRQRE